MSRDPRTQLTALLASLMLLIHGGMTPTSAQESSDKELDQLKKQKEYAETRKAIAEAELAELKARFPEPKSTPLAGTTTINDGAVIESQMISYAAMARASNKMAEAIRNNRANMNVLAIFNQNEVNNLLGYRAARNQVEILKNNYCEILDHTK